MIRYIALLIFYPMILIGSLDGTQPYIKLSHHISDQFVKDYSRRTGVYLCGFGGGMTEDIELICLTFDGRYGLDVPAARRLYIDGIEDLLHRYNTDKAVRPYLHNFPFTLSNLRF